jgi:hypothetical protein
MDISLKEFFQKYTFTEMVDMLKPLYHYTSISNLALILSSKKLKLNSLKYVDDLKEGYSEDIGDIRKYYFVSCWTKLEEESIPMWKMYTPDMKGVRISLPKYPFTTHSIEYKPKKLSISYPNTFFNESQVVNDDYLLWPSNKILYEIKYTEDQTYLNPKILEAHEQLSGVAYKMNMGIIGKYKNKIWSFQEEYRYIVNAIPGFGILKYEKEIIPDDEMIKAINEKRDLPIDSFYLDLREDALSQMKIVLGPLAGKGERIIVESLIEKYFPSIQLTDSNLSGCIK